MPESRRLTLESSHDTETLGQRLAIAVADLAVPRFDIHLVGDLGAGKTTFARGFLAGLGHRGRVPSPTYTLVEPYECGGAHVYHADLYRVHDSGELEYLGLNDLAAAPAIVLIEWPEHGGERLQPADLRLEFEIELPGRAVTIVPNSDAGHSILSAAAPG